MGSQRQAVVPKAVVIINAKRAPESLEPALRAAGLQAKVVLMDGDLEQTARNAVAQGATVVIAGGGDGTVSAIAAALAETESVLGVLPLGTFNNFARDLGIPLGIAAAARVIAHGRITAVDVGEVNGRVFINNSSIGLYPWIVERREHYERKGHNRFLAFVWASLPVLRRYRLLSVHLNVDGVGLVRHTPFVFVGNNVYRFEGLRAARRDSISAGTLCLAVAHRTGRAGLIRLAAHAVFGRLREARDFDLLTAKEISVETRRPTARVSLDGEVVRMNTPLHYRIRPGALRVFVPPE